MGQVALLRDVCDERRRTRCLPMKLFSSGAKAEDTQLDEDLMRGWCCRIVMGIAAVLPIGAGAQPSARSLPGGFVYLREIDPSIRQDMRYATANNFTGGVVNGYQAPECILTLKTAQALARAQALLAGRYPGHVLKVYDCYRPVRAVKRFMAWTNERGTADGNYYHPSIPRGRRALDG